MGQKQSISAETLLIGLLIGIAFGHLAAAGDIGLHPPLGTVAMLLAALALYIAVKLALAHKPNRVRSATRPPEEDGAANAPDAALASLARERGLSARENEVFALLAKGSSSADIQQSLGISPNTVKTHLRHVYRKMGVHSLDELHALVAAARSDTAQRQ